MRQAAGPPCAGKLKGPGRGFRPHQLNNVHHSSLVSGSEGRPRPAQVAGLMELLFLLRGASTCIGERSGADVSDLNLVEGEGPLGGRQRLSQRIRGRLLHFGGNALPHVVPRRHHLHRPICNPRPLPLPFTPPLIGRYFPFISTAPLPLAAGQRPHPTLPRGHTQVRIIQTSAFTSRNFFPSWHFCRLLKQCLGTSCWWTRAQRERGEVEGETHPRGWRQRRAWRPPT